MRDLLVEAFLSPRTAMSFLAAAAFCGAFLSLGAWSVGKARHRPSDRGSRS